MKTDAQKIEELRALINRTCCLSNREGYARGYRNGWLRAMEVIDEIINQDENK